MQQGGDSSAVLGLLMRASRSADGSPRSDGTAGGGAVSEARAEGRSPTHAETAAMLGRLNVSGNLFERWRGQQQQQPQQPRPSLSPHRYEMAPTPAEAQRRKQSLFFRRAEAPATAPPPTPSPRHSSASTRHTPTPLPRGTATTTTPRSSPKHSAKSAPPDTAQQTPPGGDGEAEDAVRRSVCTASVGVEGQALSLTRGELSRMPDSMQRDWARQVTPATTTRTKALDPIFSDPAGGEQLSQLAPDAFSPAPTPSAARQEDAPQPLSLSIDESAIVADSQACDTPTAAPRRVGDTDTPQASVCAACLGNPHAGCRALPCGHALCLACAAAVGEEGARPAQEGHYRCPTCGVRHAVSAALRAAPLRGAPSAPGGGGVRRIHDFFEMAQCGRCQSEAASLSCLDCRLSFCQACSDLIHTGSLRAHYLEVHRSYPSPAAGLCPKAAHGSRLSYYDTHRGRFICSECIADEQLDREGGYVPLSDAAKDAQRELASGHDVASGFLSRVKATVGVLRDQRDRVEALRRDEMRHVEGTFADWRQKLQEREEEIARKTASFYDEQQAELEHEMGKQMALLATFNKGLHRLTCILDDHAERLSRFSQTGGDPDGIASAERDVIVSRELTRIDELLALAESQPLRVPPLSQLHLRLEENDWNLLVSATVEELKAEEATSTEAAPHGSGSRAPQWSTMLRRTAQEEISFSEVQDGSVVAEIT